MKDYRHGSYAEQVPFSGEFRSLGIETVPCYVGVAPIHLMNVNGDTDFDYSPYVNKPILIRSLSEAVANIGYSKDWRNFTLSEAVGAHMLNEVNGIAPIVLINVLDPSKHAQEVVMAETVNLYEDETGKVGILKNNLALLETLDITGVTAGDYKATYCDEGIKITITKKDYNKSTVEIGFSMLDISDTNISVDVFEKGVDAIELCNPMFDVRPNILAAPKYSSKPDYHKLMIKKANEKITEKWNLICVSDIPCTTDVNTFDKAIAWKKTNFYNNKLDKVCWLKATYNEKAYHLSTLAVVTMQYEDSLHDGVPHVSPSNKLIQASGLMLDDGKPIYINELNANKLNKKGITTGNIIRGRLRLWGSHMANYDFDKEKEINPEDMFDSSIRMSGYLLNTLQYEWIDEIDTSFTKRDVDALLATIQKWLNTLVNEGKLLYAEINFNDTSNQTSEIVSGNFVFDVKHTVAPNIKSINYKVQYVLDGLKKLVGGEA